MYVNNTTAKEFYETTDMVTISGLYKTIVQENDQIYIGNAIDGSLVTNINIVDSTLRILALDTSGSTSFSISWRTIYAYETYWLFTEEGIRDEGRFIEAIDNANYIVHSFKIRNDSSPTKPLILIDGFGVSGSSGYAVDVLDNTGGTIISAPDRVIPFASATATIDIVKQGMTAQGYTEPRAIKIDSISRNTGLIPALL